MSVMEIMRLGSGAGTRAVSAEHYRVVAGSPTARATNTFSDVRGVDAGVAIYEPGSVELLGYPHDEYCFLLEGEVIITDASGKRQIFKRGDAFLLPRGFKGLWEMPQGMQKYYVVFDAPAKLASMSE